MIRVVVPAENVINDGDDKYRDVAYWLEYHEIVLNDVTYVDLDTVEFIFDKSKDAMFFKLAWA